MRHEKGFTLIELMIVIAIIAIIAAIAIPNLIRSKLSANETEAIGGLKTVATGNNQYKHGNETDADADGIGEYGTLNQMNTTVPPIIADGALGDADADAVGETGGYNITVTLTGVTATDEVQFWAAAVPKVYQQTGVRTFYVDESGMVRASDNAGAAPLTRAAGLAWPIAR